MTRRSRALTLGLSLAALFILARCERSQTREEPSAIPQASPASLDSLALSVVAGNNQFAFGLYDHLRREPGNVVFSPFSISTALAMTYAGASGTTAQEMASTLHLPATGDRLHEAYAALLQTLDADAEKSYQLKIANRLWGQRGYGFLDALLRTTREHYGAGLEEMDFTGDFEGARKTINEWVKTKTEGKIEDLLAAGSLDTMTRLVLTNAIYFYGTWKAPFDSTATTEMPFSVDRTATVKVPMMNRTGSFRYAKLDALSLIELPYKDDDLAMIVLLPDSVEGLSDVEARLSALQLEKWLAVLAARQVRVSLPRFRTTNEYTLNGTLKRLGMGSAFDSDAADFSAMNGRRDLYISLVVHKAYVDVNERGTEAAAATGAAMATKSAMADPIRFVADHPFVFLIRDQRTGSILFLGRVTDPSKSGA